jgi:hypothetical protein
MLFTYLGFEIEEVRIKEITGGVTPALPYFID